MRVLFELEDDDDFREGGVEEAPPFLVDESGWEETALRGGVLTLSADEL